MRIFLTETSIIDDRVGIDLRALITLYRRNTVPTTANAGSYTFLVIINIYKDKAFHTDNILTYTNEIISNVGYLLGVITSNCRFVITYNGLKWTNTTWSNTASAAIETDFINISDEDLTSISASYI